MHQWKGFYLNFTCMSWPGDEVAHSWTDLNILATTYYVRVDFPYTSPQIRTISRVECTSKGRKESSSLNPEPAPARLNAYQLNTALLTANPFRGIDIGNAVQWQMQQLNVWDAVMIIGSDLCYELFDSIKRRVSSAASVIRVPGPKTALHDRDSFIKKS